MDIFINFIVLIISQCIHISKHQGVRLKYIQFFCVNYISIQLEKINKKTLYPSASPASP